MVAPAILCCLNFLIFDTRARLAASITDLLSALAAPYCAIVSVNALCANGPAAYLRQANFYGLQLVTIHLLAIALAAALIGTHLVRRARRQPGIDFEPRVSDWIFGIVFLPAYFSGLFIYERVFSSLWGNAWAAAMACLFLLYVRILLSPLMRKAAPKSQPSATPPVVRR